jgi:PAS domain S-box-containing protein
VEKAQGRLPGVIRSAVRDGRWWALATLLVGLAITALVARHQKLDADQDARQAFYIVCSEVGLRVEGRLREHEQILRSAAGFFADENGVTREEWHEYAERQKLGQKLPGIQGIGFAQFVPREQLAQVTQRIRAEGFPDFRVWPEGDREAYSSIVFLEPFSGRNLRAFGYDMLSEPVRREAMEQARDQDRATLSGRVTLVQETDRDVQAGALMYAPVYRMREPHETVADRRAAILGWAYSPYRMNDLMAGILGKWADREQVDLEISDGETPSRESLLYASRSGEKTEPSRTTRLARQIVIDAAGRKWLLSFGQDVDMDYSLAWLVLGGGATLSLLLSGLLYSLSRTGIRARVLAEQLTAGLSESEMRWRIAVEGTGDGLYDWDVQTGKGFYSRRWKEMLGYSDGEISTDASEWESRIHPDDKAGTMAVAKALLDGSIPLYSHEHRMRCKDGSWKWVLARGVVIRRDPAGRPLRVVGTHSDITEKRQMAEIKNRLVSMASHEFRTPLATIRVAADLLATRRDKMDEEGIQRALETILDTTDYMTSIVADVLELSAMTRDGQAVELSEFPLGDFLRQIAAEFRVPKPSPAALALEWDGSPVTCIGIPALLKRSVNNLLDNAVKYSPPGKPVVLRLRQEGKEAVIQVEDQGMGIPEEAVAFLFDPFFRASNTVGIPGTGLGLAIVAEAMQRMGGKIEHGYRANGGTIFTIRLPLARGGAAVNREPVHANKTILIVDDDTEILEFYRKLFAPSGDQELDILGMPPCAPGHGLTVRAFSNPLEVLEEYERAVKAGERYPLCIMDMRMPVLNGLAAAVRMRELDPEINIVICTAFSDVPINEVRAQLHNEVFFVRKPFVVEEFQLLIHSLVGHWNTQQELKRTRADLAAQCEKLGLVLEGTRVGTWDWKIPDGQVEFNERWAEIVGYELRELEPTDIGTWTRLCHPDDLVRSGALLEKVFSREAEYYDCECRMLHRNGSWIWVWDRGKVTEWSPDGKPLRMLGTHTDITEKRQMIEIKSRLVSMASHEFRTPLATIRLAADLLASRRDQLGESGIQRAVETILSTTDYMTGIVTDVLDLSTMTREGQAAALSQIPLGDFLRQIAADFQAAQPGPATLTFEGDGSPLTCIGIPALLKRAVNNLLDNAVKYSPPGTPVVLRLRQEGVSALVQVEDHGMGIPEEEVAFLHDPFFRASNTVGIPGTGLGLAIVSEAMQRMGGKIEYAKRDGGGSIFTIRLPVVDGPEESSG